VYNTAVREYALFLRLLAERVYTARLDDGRSLRDVMDFKEWLFEAADKAERAGSLPQFFEKL
jgi:hypothetical protein